MFWFISGVVIQLKTIAGALSADESFSNLIVEKTRVLQKILVYVVSIMCSFIDLNSNVNEKVQLYSNTIEFSILRQGASSSDSSKSLDVPLSEARLNWHKKAVVSVMEAGGLNWLVGKVGNFSFYFHLLNWLCIQKIFLCIAVTSSCKLQFLIFSAFDCYSLCLVEIIVALKIYF